MPLVLPGVRTLEVEGSSDCFSCQWLSFFAHMGKEQAPLIIKNTFNFDGQ